MENRISFGSDTYSGVSQEIMEYLVRINRGHSVGYGEDKYTQKALELFKEELGAQIDVYFLYNTTACNTLALSMMTQSFNSVICSDISHIMVHEVTAPQTWTGCKFITLPHKDGKISVSQIEKAYNSEVFWGRHASMPKVVSITQPTELGTLYSFEEIKNIADFCHKNKMYLHMDGARIANACVAMELTFKEITSKAGVDVLSFGATKNGLMFGDALVFFDAAISRGFEYRQKQGLQLHSKMRFLAGQFIPYLENRLWFKYAQHANAMAKRLSEQLRIVLPGSLAYPALTNQIFAYLPEFTINKLLERFYFYVFNPDDNLVRLVTSFTTTEKDVDAFTDYLKEIV